MSKQLVAYVAGPYRHGDGAGVQRNIQAARYAAMELWKMNYAVVCPHANSGYMDVDGGIEDDVFLRGDLEILRRCDFLVVLPGWQDSAGTKAEIAEAFKLLMIVRYWPSCRDTLARLARREALDNITAAGQAMGDYDLPNRDGNS